MGTAQGGSRRPIRREFAAPVESRRVGTCTVAAHPSGTADLKGLPGSRLHQRRSRGDSPRRLHRLMGGGWPRAAAGGLPAAALHVPPPHRIESIDHAPPYTRGEISLHCAGAGRWRPRESSAFPDTPTGRPAHPPLLTVGPTFSAWSIWQIGRPIIKGVGICWRVGLCPTLVTCSLLMTSSSSLMGHVPKLTDSSCR